MEYVVIDTVRADQLTGYEWVLYKGKEYVLEAIQHETDDAIYFIACDKYGDEDDLTIPFDDFVDLLGWV